MARLHVCARALPKGPDDRFDGWIPLSHKRRGAYRSVRCCLYPIYSLWFLVFLVSLVSFFFVSLRNGAGSVAVWLLVVWLWWFGFERRAVSSWVVTLDHVILDCRSRISDLYPRTINPVKDYFQEFTIFFRNEKKL